MTSFVLYHRIAAEDRQDLGSPQDGQLARCLAFIESSGWPVVAEYTEYAEDAQGAAE